MARLKHPTFRVFDTRESEEYKRLLSKVLSIKKASPATYPDLITSSYKLNRIAADKVTQGYGSKINRVINIDYIGMAATVLLDRDGNHTKNTHYDRLYELLSSLDELNEEGIAVRIRLLLQYPYSLAGQNRILSEHWSDRAFMGEANGRDETQLAPALTAQLIEHSPLHRAQQDCLEHLQHLPKPSSPNKIETRFAFISTLICGLRVNKFFFYDPYHYGQQRGKKTSALISNPVVMIDGSNNCVAYQAFCNHFRVIWECDSTLDYDDVAPPKDGATTVIIKKPENLDTSHKTERLKTLYKTKHLKARSSRDKKINWERRARQLHQLVTDLCPILPPVDDPEVGFLAAAWEPKKDGSTGPCVPSLILEEMFSDAFESLNRNVRVNILQGGLGASLSGSLFGFMDTSTFSIILLTKEIEEKFCKPNIYFELGYLLHKNKKGRTFIVLEEKTSPPSDLSDIIFTQFKRGKPQPIDEMKRVCKELLEAIRKRCCSPAQPV